MNIVLARFKSLPSYFYYLFTALNRHGIHPPFLYNLYTKVILAKIDSNIFLQIEEIRKIFTNSAELITINDLGSGSKTKKSNLRSVKSIVSNAVSNKKKSILIYKLIKHFQPQVMVEIGTSLGLNAAYMSLANSSGKIYTLEGCEQLAKKAKQVFSDLKLTNIDLVIGDFDNTLEELLAKNGEVNFVFIDGNHKLKPTLQYFETIMKYANQQTIIVMDDIHWSTEMTTAWESVKNMQNVTCTVDLYQVGIIFLNKSLSKQNFILKY